MLRFLFTIAAISCLASATTTTYVSCSAGSATQTGSTACTLQNSQYFVFATAHAPEDPNAVVSAFAAYQAGLNPPPPYGKVQIAVAAYASETKTFGTTGPPRLGLIQFDISMGSREAGTAEASITDGVHNYSFSCGPGSLYGCPFHEEVPFDLGAMFEATASGSAHDSGLFTPQEAIYAGPSAAVESIRLFESDGITPVAFTLVPEPSARSFMLIGFAAAALVLSWHFRSAGLYAFKAHTAAKLKTSPL